MWFENDTHREIDLRPYLSGPIFAPIRDDPEFFAQVMAEGGRLAWPNRSDIAPDVLYSVLEPAGLVL